MNLVSFVRDQPSFDSNRLFDLAMIPWRDSFGQVESKDVDEPPSLISTTSSRSSTSPSKLVYSPDRGQASVSLIRCWLDECRNYHQETCSRTVLQERFGRTVDLLLIDVANKCLMCSTSESGYVSLSYVWGGVSAFKPLDLT